MFAFHRRRVAFILFHVISHHSSRCCRRGRLPFFVRCNRLKRAFYRRLLLVLSRVVLLGDVTRSSDSIRRSIDPCRCNIFDNYFFLTGPFAKPKRAFRRLSRLHHALVFWPSFQHSRYVSTSLLFLFFLF